MAFPVKPTWMLTEEDCEAAIEGGFHPCNAELEWNWLGTDDQGRDVVARVIYGFRISVLFGLVLTLFSSVIGVAAGAVQGYFGGWTDLLFQRFIEIWTSVPQLYLLIIVAAVIEPNFWILLGILLAFSWVALVGVVRAEFLRARNFEYVTAARALGLSNIRIIFKHLLPNAMVATLTFMPFILNGSISTLTSLDFLGVGLPAGSPSLGELLAQGKDNLQAPWLGLTAFFVIAIMLSLLIFIGEAVRDALDPRKSFGVTDTCTAPTRIPTPHGPDHSHGPVTATTPMSGAWGSRRCITGLFMVAEVAGGIVSGSLALLADAGHMLTDFASLSLAWFGFRLARRPADWMRTYGFDRFQVLVAFANGLALFAIAAWIVYEAIERLSPAAARRRRHDGGGGGPRPSGQYRRLRAAAWRRPRESQCPRRGRACARRSARLGGGADRGRRDPLDRLDADRSAPVGPRRRHHREERLAGGGRPGHILLEGAPHELDTRHIGPDLIANVTGVHERASCACVVDHAGAAHGDAACLCRGDRGRRPDGQGHQAAPARRASASTTPRSRSSMASAPMRC